MSFPQLAPHNMDRHIPAASEGTTPVALGMIHTNQDANATIEVPPNSDSGLICSERYLIRYFQVMLVSC